MDLAAWVERMRELQATARPVPRQPVLTAEQTDPALGDAVRRVGISPNSGNHVAAALAYYRAGVLDIAQDHLAEAVRLDRSDAAAYDLRARIWRDWGLPGMGLGDAYRAVYYAPESPEARNTLGTMFLRLGQIAEARSAYARATELDNRAAYAWSNLCHVSALEGDLAAGERACRRALALDPAFAPARRNLERIHILMAAAATSAEGRQ